MRIVGIDCATDPRKTGVVALDWDGQLARVTMATLGEAGGSVAAIADAAAGREPALFCLDAPLGWPMALGRSLGPHRAGDALAVPEANRLFRRRTDEFVRARLGKQPLEVGADRIARTAASALALLSELRQRRGETIPLAWRPAIEASAAIEVYPAAVLLVRGLPASRYKPAAAQALRRQILGGLAGELAAGRHQDAMVANADILDAALAGLAGVDFLSGACAAPEDADLAVREGWIWIAGRMER
ncbi:MAG: DUF429 domain-containing protein [Gammaproteobacteria bacterium]|jgi:predicted RNase H-like nuclease